jgi:hypothetical protein
MPALPKWRRGEAYISYSMSDIFNELWNEAVVHCLPEKETRTSIGEIDLLFRYSDRWTEFFLRQILSSHLVEHPFKGTAHHEIAIVQEKEPPETSDQDLSPSWKGCMSDGTPVSVLRWGESMAKIKVGPEVTILLNMSQKKTLCRVAEVQEDNHGSKTRRPQPAGFLIPLLHLLLSAYNSYLVHASAVAHEGKCILILGEAGAGKTTMSLALARKGMEFMGDDLIMVEKVQARPRAHALLLKPKIQQKGQEGKMSIDCIAQEKLPVCQKADIAAVALLEKSQEVYDFRRTSMATVLTWLLMQGNDLPLMWYPADWFETASAIADKATGWIWTVGHPDNLEIDSVKKILKG